MLRWILRSILFAALVPAVGRITLAIEPRPGFRSDVMAVLSKAGCNQGTCHGNAHGKGGLKLSLRGQHPDADYLTLTRQSAARRVTLLNPAASLLLQKPAMMIPHEGGRRFDLDSREYQILHDWIAAGLPDDAANAARLVSLRVSPSHQTIEASDHTVTLQAFATFSDGTSRDVTALTIFDSSATFVTIQNDGSVRSQQPGLTTITARYQNQQVPVRLEFVPDRPNFTFQAPDAVNAIDDAVFAQLKRLKINPSGICDDATFLRRAYLDLTGLLPPVDVAQTFPASTEPDKRSRLIDRLLASDSFNDFQTLRWADPLRVEEKTLDKTGVEVFHNWIRTSFAEQRPLNEFAAAIIEARGSTYKVPPANFYRALRQPEERAEAVAQVFLGIRLQCAKCHNHPFDHWTQDDYYGWANYFARIDYRIIENKRRDKSDKHEFAGEQIVEIKDKGDVKNPDTGRIVGLRLLSSDTAAGADTETSQESQDAATAGDPEPDRLQRLAAWLGDSDNERFAATQANRIWAQIMGRGVIDPVDDFRSTNPPSNPELLNVLRSEFVGHNFDVRHLMRLILNSHTYQLASVANETNDTDSHCFARTELRRLSAEQTLDAIAHVLDVPVKYGGHAEGTLAVQLQGVRNGDFRYSSPEVGDQFLRLFGKPSRLQTCDCERTSDTTLAQTFEMVSGELISQLLPQDGNRIDKALQQRLSNEQIVRQFYLAALTREPASDEIVAAERHLRQHADRRQALEDIVWALLNSNEFLLRR
ncbi:MAG: DUF1553 domain-containing protein [Planctomycetaceae bacterium]